MFSIKCLLDVLVLRLKVILIYVQILSSPVRDLNHGLCKLETGEASMNLDVCTDHSLELKMALQTCCLRDIRVENSCSIKKYVK